MGKKKISLVLCLFFLTTIGVIAQTINKKYFGIIIEPAVKAVAISPGETISGEIRLTNDFQSQKSMTFYPYAINFRQQDDTGNAELYLTDNLDINSDATQWVDFAEESYLINFGETAISHYTITAPGNAIGGGFYIALVYSQSGALQGPQTIGLGEEIGCLFFITVRGDNVESTELLRFYSGQGLYDMPPTDMYIRVFNNGNVHSTIGGNIFIHQGDLANPIETITVNPDNFLNLPNGIRTYRADLEKGFIYFEDGQLKIDLTKHFYFGQYTATLKMRHMVDNQKVTDEREIKFWVIPWKLILLAIATLIVIYFVQKTIKKVFKKVFKKKKKHEQPADN